MKQKLLFLLLTALLPLRSVARDFEYTYEGQTIIYTVLNEDARTCATKNGDYYDVTPGNNISGDLVLPAHPQDGDIEFTLTEIGDAAFCGCISLNSVALPNSVTTIDSFAFSYCWSLTSIVLPTSVYDIGWFAFADCRSLTSVTIPTSVSSISYGAFAYCSSLTSMAIPASVTSIGVAAYNGCSSLTTIEIPNSVTEIGSSAFRYCSSLTSIEIPASVTSIGTSAFGSCDNLTEIIVDENSENYCSVDGILFSKDTTVLLQYPAGKNCNDYTIPDIVIEIADYAFHGSRRLTSIEIPSSVTSIGDCAFWNCSSLTSIELPNSVTYIGWSAFCDCSSLTSIVLPTSVTEIGELAFKVCSSLTTVIYNTDAPVTCPSNIFDGETYSTAELIIPEGTLATFMATEPWNQFLKITEKDLSGIENVVIDADAVGIDYDSPYQVYDLNGYLTGTSVKGLKPGIYIIRQGTKSRKILLN